jgi:hypothetical protein
MGIHDQTISYFLEAMKQYILQNGIFLQIKKQDDTFVITEAIGDKMMQDLNIPQEKYIGISSNDFSLYMPQECAKRKVEMLSKVWDEHAHIIYTGVVNGVNYYSLMDPVFENGVISHIDAYMFYSSDILENMFHMFKAHQVPCFFFQVA